MRRQYSKDKRRQLLLITLTRQLDDKKSRQLLGKYAELQQAAHFLNLCCMGLQHNNNKLAEHSSKYFFSVSLFNGICEFQDI